MTFTPLLFIVFLLFTAAAWVGAAVVTVDSLMMGGLMSNLTFHKLRLNYGLGFITNHNLHFGDGLIGLWLTAMNIYAYAKKRWPRNITNLGFVSGVLLSLGVFGLEVGFFGSIGQMIWNIWLGLWIFRNTFSEEAGTSV